MGEGAGIMASFKAMKAVTARLPQELRLEQQRINKRYNVFNEAGDGKDAMSNLTDGMDAMMPVVRPGDASVAAPFTSKIPSVKSVIDLIRQGRCTLLSALQQQQIMMLQCMISAYCLSALNLNGSRSSERQMMASGWL